HGRIVSHRGQGVNPQMPTPRHLGSRLLGVARDTAKQQISREVKRALQERGLSARAAADKMGVEPKTIYRWINGDNYPKWDQLEAFVKHVGPIRLTLGTKKDPRP